ncbi:OsmC family protein [Sphingobacterium thalpophilum]|uniref:Peroxiredoxin, SACOL1771 subfamily n=1 Tax=Sphingobacterium thalpophilum TaxID=259 RepID=A0A4U9VN84_9SPHI|nr:OsmC family protein [Sphingobacterium thalpophilum]VTR48726.1 peroxiredoxin, SACOL1771 subfamily [Sphingobacterium thalpophilum]
MSKKHHYKLNLIWTGNLGSGTSSYNAYSRDHEINAKGKPVLLSSSDPSFRGNKSRYNPEELLVASLSSCHMLWYLHLCSVNGVVVIDYVEEATGTMQETAEGSGAFTEVSLNPVVTVANEDMIELAQSLHSKANELCFIANSCNFPVYHNPQCKVLK